MEHRGQEKLCGPAAFDLGLEEHWALLCRQGFLGGLCARLAQARAHTPRQVCGQNNKQSGLPGHRVL